MEGCDNLVNNIMVLHWRSKLTLQVEPWATHTSI